MKDTEFGGHYNGTITVLRFIYKEKEKEKEKETANVLFIIGLLGKNKITGVLVKNVDKIERYLDCNPVNIDWDLPEKV